MIVIEGNKKILEEIEKELEKTWKALSIKFRKVRGKILFAYLFTMNLRFSPSKESYATEDVIWFRSMLRLLDVLLEHEWTLVDSHMKQDQLTKFTRIILHEFSKLGKLRQLQLECSEFEIDSIEYDEEQGLSEATVNLDIALKEWLNTSYLDEDWVTFTDDRHTRAPELLESLNYELHAKYNINLQGLNKFGQDFTEDIVNHLEPETNKMATLLSLRKQDFTQRLRMLDRSIDVESLIRDLEYRPKGNWMCAPFVKLKDNSTQQMLYFPLTFAFYPANIFAASWIYYLSKTVRTSPAMGIMAHEWGRKFERYVREKLAKYHPHLEILPGTSKISKPKNTAILDCIGKPEIEIDVIAQSDTKVYLISCKALDQFYGSNMFERLLGSTMNEFESKLKEDITNAGEIETYTRCIQQSKKYIEHKGFQGKKIIPILMTSDVRPLSLDSIRDWTIAVKYAESLPDVQLISAKEICNRLFD